MTSHSPDRCPQVKAGTLIVLHGSNVHFSHENSSAKSRHAYSVHYIDGSPDVVYPSDNWYASPAL